MNAFTQKPDVSKFIKESRSLLNKTQSAKAGMGKLTEQQRKALLSPAVPKEKK